MRFYFEDFLLPSCVVLPNKTKLLDYSIHSVVKEGRKEGGRKGIGSEGGKEEGRKGVRREGGRK